MTSLPEPDLTLDADGVLRSLAFDDIYFSPEDGLAESRYNFIDGNGLPERLSHASERRFVVGELGFGTGLNILALLQQHDESLGGPLTIWSVEGFPLSKSGFTEAQERTAARWPEIASYAELLAERYPEPTNGSVTLDLGDEVHLELVFGPVEAALRSADFVADAWFLDGFAPSKNPDMWSPSVLSEVGRLTKTGGTAATFSVASSVRQSLEAAGFAWEKAPGFGRKRQMLKATRL